MPLRPLRRRAPASTLLAALLSILVITLITAGVLQRIASRTGTAHRSIAWNDALTTAEAAADMTIADLSALLPDVRLNSGSGVTLGVSQLPSSIVSSLGIGSNGLSLAQGTTLSFSPAALTHGGEGAGRQEASVSIDVLSLNQLLTSGALSVQGVSGLNANPLGILSGGDLQLVRLRVRGTVNVPGRRADDDALDARLRRQTLVWDRRSGQGATAPSVSREIEVLLKPVFPWQGAVTSGGTVSVPASDAVFDSFNPLNSAASTLGLYDLTKRLSNGDVTAGNDQLTLAGSVYGDVRTSGANFQKTDRISGEVDNSFSQPLPLIRPPSWSATPVAVTGTTVLPAGTPLTPARYKFTSINGTLRITAGLLGLGTNVEIWVTGNVAGRLIFDPGVRAKLYVEGNVQLDPGCLTNGSQRASALQIYGIPGAASAPAIQLGLGDVTAAIYAPTHAVRLTGSGDFQGGITCGSFEATAGACVHFDESLSINAGPILRYAVASWIEPQD